VTARQQRFISEYLTDLNATQAAIRAGYSAKTAAEMGAENLRKPQIAAAIAAGKAQQLEKADLSAARVLEEYRRLGFSDLGAIFDDAGRLKSLKELPPEVRAAIASVKVTKKNLTAGDGITEDVVEVRLWDKTRALESLAKHFSLLVDRVEVSGKVDVVQILRQRFAKRQPEQAERGEGA
jgi:phage terminase small subunit